MFENENENAEIMFETTNITDLNTDCMEAIFNFLEFNDLLNIVESNKQFQTAACNVYKKKYAGQNLMFQPGTTDHSLQYRYSCFNLYFKVFSFYFKTNFNFCSSLAEFDEKSIISIRSNPFRVLRKFGHLIQNLAINLFDINATLCTEIENYLTLYCTDSLQRLYICCNSLNITFKHLQKPLNKLTYLLIFFGRGQTMDTIQFLNENNLPNVNEINMKIFIDEPFKTPVYSKNIHFRNVEYLWIYSSLNSKYPFSFENLKHLTLVGNYSVNDALCECISTFKHLKTLKIMSTTCIFSKVFSSHSFSKILQLQNLLSNLEEMKFEYNTDISPTDVFGFLKKSQNLKILSMHSEKEPRLTFLNQNSVPVGWKMFRKKLSHESWDNWCAKICVFYERVTG